MIDGHGNPGRREANSWLTDLAVLGAGLALALPLILPFA